MEPARFNQIEELLQAALDREHAEREAFLREACGDDAELLREVRSLLEHEQNDILSRFPQVVLDAHRHSLTGRRINQYIVERRIGAGGMGEVYEARDQKLQRVVALKVLPEEFGNDADRVRRFEQEALSASRLNHPNIITIFEILASEGSHFIAAERIEGHTLRQLLTDDDGRPRKLALSQALEIVVQIAAALKAAHTAWIIHRDIKPENIMLRGDGLVKVLDFGIAKLSEEPASLTAPSLPPPSDPGSTLTIPGAIMGTAVYMSPEQARGEPLDGRTDLYSLGVVFLEMVTAERNPQKARLDSVPRDIGRIIQKLLKSDREERCSSAADLLDELLRVKRRLENRTARRMVGFGALAIVAALLVAGIAAFLSVNETWEERVLRDGHTAAVRQAIFSPDGKTVVSCGEDGQVIIWDFARRQRMATLHERAYKVAYSPDGRWLAIGATDGTITIRDVRTRAILQRLRPERIEVGALLFSTDGSRLVAGYGNHSYLWRTAGWQLLGQWPLGTHHGNFAIFGTSFLSTGTLTAFDEAGMGRPFNDRLTGTSWLAQSADGMRLAGIDTAGKVWFYRVPKPGHYRGLETIAVVPAHRDHGRAIAYSPDGRLVASGADDILLWDPETRSKVARFEYPSVVWSVEFSPDGKWLLSTHGDGSVLVWDVRERERVASLNEHSAGVRAVAFSPDGRRIASASEDRTVALWDLATGRRQAVLFGHTTRLMGVAFARNTGELGSVDQHSNLIVWDLERRVPRVQFAPTTPNAGYCFGISADGQLMASTSGVWNRQGRMVLDLREFSMGQVYGLAFSDDRTKLATATSSGEVSVWDLRTFKLEARRKVPGTHQIAASISPDGKFLATGEDEGRIRLWSVSPFSELAILGRHAARVKYVAFSPDGRFVASAGDDKMIALWDVRRRKLHARVGTHASPIYGLAFSPDGRQLASGEHDRTVRVYTRQRTLWGFRLE